MEVELEKSQVKNPKRAKQGEATPCKENLRNKEIDEIVDFEVGFKEKVILNKNLVFFPTFIKKVFSKGVQDLNAEVDTTTRA